MSLPPPVPTALASADFSSLETPAYVVDLQALEKNLTVLADVQTRAKCKILLALKGFAMWSTFPLIKKYLSGIAASSTAEARLGREKFGKEVHAYAPAYSQSDMKEMIGLADHIVFNSFSQWEALRDIVKNAPTKIECGVRINPEHSEVATPLYDPCSPGSRMGVLKKDFRDDLFAEMSGLHFHTLCELNSDSLERTLAVVEKKFAAQLARCQWVNFGGGHHITRADYDRERLIRIVTDFKSRYDIPVYLEPGEAIALNTGVLVSQVLDITNNSMDIAILDCSATAHMPDVLEMPYRPVIVGGALPGEKKYTYRLGGQTCLAGDVIGDYSFDKPLRPGDKLVFLDMAHYTMVKNTTFNGVQLPSIATWHPQNGFHVVRRFGYEDYASRLS